MKCRSIPRRPRNRHFDLLASIYDRLAPAAYPDKLKELLRLPGIGWLLDAGGGTGRVGVLLREQIGGIVVLDFSRPMLKRSLRKPGLLPVQGDAGDLPFRGESFDRIMAVDALHHFPDQDRAIAEMVRVLKPGGVLLIEEFDIRRPLVRLLALIEKIILMGSQFQPPEEIHRMVMKTGAYGRVEEGHNYVFWIVVEKR